MFDIVMNENEATKTSSEGYNHALQMSIPNHANIWMVIKQFKSEDALMAIKLCDAAVGVLPEGGRKNKEYEQKKKDLRKLMYHYGHLQIEEYMQYMLTYFNNCLVI